MNFTPNNFEYIRWLLDMIYCSYLIRSQSTSQAQFEEKLNERLAHLQIMKRIRSYSFTYNDSCWPSGNSLLEGNVVNLKVQITGKEEVNLKLDFSKPITSGGVQILIDGSYWHTNPLEFVFSLSSETEFLQGIEKPLK